jgi:hypothetical protein
LTRSQRVVCWSVRSDTCSTLQTLRDGVNVTTDFAIADP